RTEEDVTSVYVQTSDDVYGFVNKAVVAGAVGEIAEGADGPVGKLNDPYGYVWMVSRKEEKQAPLLDVVATGLNCVTIYVLLKFVIFLISIIVNYFYPDLPIYYN
ncbi:hypothetical protein MKX03_024385, partial [Papaver bracteatum]